MFLPKIFPKRNIFTKNISEKKNSTDSEKNYFLQTISEKYFAKEEYFQKKYCAKNIFKKISEK